MKKDSALRDRDDLGAGQFFGCIGDGLTGVFLFGFRLRCLGARELFEIFQAIVRPAGLRCLALIGGALIAAHEGVRRSLDGGRSLQQIPQGRVRLAVFFFLAAIGIMLYPMISSAYNKKHQSELLTDYSKEIDQAAADELIKAKEQAAAYNRTLIPGVQMVDAFSKEALQDGKDMVTLITCHPYASGGKQRYVIYCERES